MQKIEVRAAGGSYAVEIENGILGRLEQAVSAYRRILLVMDEQVRALFGKEVDASLSRSGKETIALTLRGGGYARTLEALREVAQKMNDLDMGEGDALLVVGGGSLLDMCGYAAWNHRKVVGLLQAPTTLLSMLDWAVGGKSAVTNRAGGRMLGCFFPPTKVLVDPTACYTLSDRAFQNGMAEALKTACVLDASLFHMLESLEGSRAAVEARAEEIIWRCLYLKSEVQGKRDEAHLLFGHQLAHAIEVSQRYRGLWHGEAVAVGMLLTTRYSQKAGYTARGTAERLARCLDQWKLPLEVDVDEKSIELALRVLGNGEAPLIERVGWSTLRQINNSFFAGAWKDGAAARYTHGGEA